MTNERYQIIASLEAGETPEEIAGRLNLAKAKVLRIKIAYDKAIIEGTLESLVDVNELVLLNALQESREQVPTMSSAIDEVGNQMSEGIDRLRRLDDQLIATATFANTRIRSLMATANTAAELETGVASLCKLREAFFNKNLTQVNIQNNLSNSGAAAYGDFLSDKPN